MIPSTNVALPTVGDVLELPQVRRGRPTVEAGRRALDRRVRWVHVSEVADIAHLLEGGELILSTGVALPTSDQGLVRYIEELAESKATGLVIELGRRFSVLPAALVECAESHALPLIALHAEVPFVAITEAIHSIIVNTQVRQLQLGDLVHRAFRSLAVETATAQEILHQVAQLAGCPAVFENPSHQVLAYECAARSESEVLDNWSQRSREAASAGQTKLTDGEIWFSSPVSARGQFWGRLVILPGEIASPLQRTIIELGATNLALHLLLERDEHHLEHQTHGTVIADIIDHRYSSPDEIHTRTNALGVPTKHRILVALVVRHQRGTPLTDMARHAKAREELTALSRALDDASVSALAGVLSAGQLGVLLSLAPPDRVSTALERLARAIHEHARALASPGSLVIGVGSPVQTIDELHFSFSEAREAAGAASSVGGQHLYVTTADIGLRGLVHLLRDDPRLQGYAERELGRLIAYDERHRGDLVATLSAYLDAGGNKSEAASALFMSRATFYHRLTRIRDILKCDLESPHTRYSLYVALVIRRSLDP